MSSRRDYKRLKELLVDWELEDLFDILKAEEISIEDLKIMRRHHLNELLKNQKLGVRIRFEHHFEEWRLSIRKPFEQPYNYPPNFQSNSTTDLKEEEQPNKILAVKDIESPDHITDISKSSRAFINITKPTTLDEQSLLLKPCNDLTDNIDLSTTLHLKYKNVCIENQLKDKNINILKVLLESGSKGESLLKQYEEYQTFTPLQRTLLIALIVSYFLMKNYHLSLSTSYVLEKQIVELFPTEKVEYYRGKSKGRIYMKYNNAKRRDIDFFPDKKRPRTSNTTDTDANASDIEMLPETSNHSHNSSGNNNANTASEQLEAFLIKTEYLSD